MKMLVQGLAIGSAGFVGAVARWLLVVALGTWSRNFPLGTFIINITGSFFLGWFMTVIGGRFPVSDTLRLAVATGFVGAYTTFSTYMYESNALLEKGAQYMAWANIIGSVIVGLIAVKLGVVLARLM